MTHILTHNQQFSSPTKALKHYGKKGMRWGVRNEEKPSGGGSSSSGGKKKPEENDVDTLKKVADEFYSTKSHGELQAEGNAKMKAQIANDHPPKQISDRRVAKAEKAEAEAAKFDKQAQEYREKAASLEGQKGIKNAIVRGNANAVVRDSEMYRDQALARAEQLRSGKLTTDQKLLIGAGAVAAVAVIGVYGHRQYQLKQAGITGKDVKRETARNKAEHERQFNEIFGEHPGFKPALHGDMAGTGGFFGGLSNKKAFDRPEFTIKEGTVFQRLSNHREDSTEYGIDKPVYSTFLSNDKKIYGASTEFGGKGLYVNFTTKGDVRVPSLPTVLAHLKEIKKQEFGGYNENGGLKHAFSDERVYQDYHAMTGGDWSSPTAKKLMSSLKSFGYGAMVDDMDAGYLGDAPLIFFGDAHPATHTERTKHDKTRDSVGIFKTSGKHA